MNQAVLWPTRFITLTQVRVDVYSAQVPATAPLHVRTGAILAFEGFPREGFPWADDTGAHSQVLVGGAWLSVAESVAQIQRLIDEELDAIADNTLLRPRWEAP